MVVKKYMVHGVELTFFQRGHYQCAIHGHGLDILKRTNHWVAVDLDPIRVIATDKSRDALVLQLLSKLVPDDTKDGFQKAMKQLDEVVDIFRCKQEKKELEQKMREQLGFQRPKAPWYTS